MEQMIPSEDLADASSSREASALPESSISRALVLILAVASAFAVANLYYNQPLLAEIARSLHVTQAQAGIVPTMTQIGYATGLLFLVPLGDIVERRRLIVLMLGGVTVALVAAANARGLIPLTIFSYAIGVTTVVPQMLIPFGVHLSAPSQRGKTVGNIMSGLLLGILLSRTAAGFVGAHLGWRAVYAIASGLMVVLAVILRLLLPTSPPTQRLGYGPLLKSVFRLMVDQPLLREAALSGALIFGAFSAFWATLAFLLSSPAYNYGAQAAGLFGLVGAVGALAASAAGRLSDRYSPRVLVGGAALVTTLSYVVFYAFGGRSILALVIGVILLDLGVQGAQVTNQTRVYNLIAGASSRLNTAYMTTYFIGGALGSALAARGWSAAGWSGVCLAGGAMAGAALVANLVASRLGKPEASVTQTENAV